MLGSKNNAGNFRCAVMTAVALLLCVLAAPARGQHNTPASHPAPAAPAHSATPHATAHAAPAAKSPSHPSASNSAHPQTSGPRTAAPGSRAASPAYANPGTVRPIYPGPPYLGPGYARPAYPGYTPPADLPRGHLGEWLNQHRNLSFHQLAPADQQRVLGQLHQVNQMTPEQQQRRVARVEMLERLSPQERMQIDNSRRRWATLPVERQAMMKNAFHDLREVPLDQRQTVLNSARYQGVFTPEERGILTDLLRVEPYQPAR
jgi:hypothetical protein